ncbi:histidine kinase [Streptomyces sp. MB09-01]|uniref:sensor histidine kinase n=1 Tax=Streptomyces sp. MB09-01 TaxID=3028666 RepID=UPI0029BE1B91|nr:histidine kinase [Streptomyces sp. MB09-01]MDX3538355.1 histidine kinase [Streptomyces sp. MB09-01]
MRTPRALAARGTKPAVCDAALWAALAGAGVFAYRERVTDASPVLALVLPLLILAVAVPGSRKRPAAAVFLANAVCALGLADPAVTASPYLAALAALTYLLGVRSARTGAALLLFGACTAVDLALCALLGVGAVYWFYAVSMIPSALLLPWLAGRYRQARLDLVRGGWERARGLEQRQRFVAEQARLRERTRIAADMHDSLGHELSLIALRAGALELSPTLSGHDRADLAVLRAAVSDAVGHLRDTIGVVREGSDGSGPYGDPTAPSVEPVEELVARARESGVTVDLRREGEAGAGLSPLVDRTAYRVVQESLTNAIKHAPGAAVRIRIVHQGARTEVRVTNSAPPAGPSPFPVPAPAGARTSGHRGLTGLRERVRLIGGTLHAAPRRGGFEVLATLPDQVGPRRPGTAAEFPEETGTGSESARRLAAVRRSTRRRFAVAIAAPAGLGLVLLGSAAYLAHQLSACVLRPADFAALRPGQERTELARLLPDREFRYVPDAVKALPAPPGTVCAYYRSNGSLLDQADVYRLCYTGSRLTAKDVLPSRPPAASGDEA